MEIRFDCVDRLAPLDEHPQRLQLRAETDLIQVAVLLAPEPEFMQRPAGQVIRILDTVLLHPADEVAQSIVVGLYGSFRYLSTPIRQEHLLGFPRHEGFEFFCHGQLELPDSAEMTTLFQRLVPRSNRGGRTLATNDVSSQTSQQVCSPIDA